jgi:hypothetical protein
MPRARGTGRIFRCAGRDGIPLAPLASSGIDAAQTLRSVVGILPRFVCDEAIDLSATEE